MSTNFKDLNIVDGILKNGKRVVIPEKIQRNVVDELHGQYHQGVENTLILIKSRFWWRKMANQIEQWVKNCQTCSSCKFQKNPKLKW